MPICKMMRLLSIDVGIKNLAACLFTIGEKTYEIEAWEVFDLTRPIVAGDAAATHSSSSMPALSSAPVCCFDKKPCSRPVAYKKFGKHFCVAHAKKSDFLMPTAEWKPTKLRALSKTALEAIVVEHKIDLPNSTHNKQNYLEAVLDYAKQRTLEPVVKVKANKLDLITIGQGIICAFAHFLGDSKVDAVIIENQISPIASRMKTIQGMIAQYFIMKGTTAIEFVSASNKLRGLVPGGGANAANAANAANGEGAVSAGDYDDRAATDDSDDDSNIVAAASGAGGGQGVSSATLPASSKKKSASQKSGYQARKSASIQIVKSMLEKNSILSKWNLFFMEHKKKDDLADCFLQGLWYIREKTVEE